MKMYKPTIGIEVHAELKTKSKMFCGCKNDPHASNENQNTCPVCLAHPGTLPVVNKEAVKKLLVVGNAVNGELATYSEFDRKNYFYPDIPKAYQLSQYKFAFVKGGELNGVKLNRIHLEEDTARSQHEGDTSVVDFNRAGVPLMELVTEPVIHDAQTAGVFVKELQLLLRTLGVSDANMERGEMRVEANISVSATDQMSSAYVEVKNLNSFKVMEAAIDFEIKRQIELAEKGEKVVQETRGWDEDKSKTFSQRSKEQAEEYRYFPDPDIPKMDLSKVDEFDISRIKEITPKLPNEKRFLYRDLGLKSDQIELIVSNVELDTFFFKLVSEPNFNALFTPTAVNYVTSDLIGLMDNSNKIYADLCTNMFTKLIAMVVDKSINSRVAKDLLPEVVFEALDPQILANERGLLQQSSDEDLIPVIESVLRENSTAVEEYKAGKEMAIKFLLGQGMKATKGSANPQTLEKLLKEMLSQ